MSRVPSGNRGRGSRDHKATLAALTTHQPHQVHRQPHRKVQPLTLEILNDGEWLQRFVVRFGGSGAEG